MLIKFIDNERGTPKGKLADVELHFSDGPLSGLKIVGAEIWQTLTGRLTVKLPGRQYRINGEARIYELVRRVDGGRVVTLRETILDSYAVHIQRTTGVQI